METKNLLLKIIVAFATILIFSSCENDTENTNRPLMTALVDGSTWRSPEPNARVSTNQIFVYGTSASGQTIQITVYNGNKGLYTLNVDNQHEGVFIPNTSSFASMYSTSSHDNGNGQVRISSINEDDKTISGKFSFTAYKESSGGSKTITNGEFTRVPYKFINNADTNDVSDIMTANIEGNSFVASTISANDSLNKINITGTQTTSMKSINLNFPDSLQSGTHMIDNSNGPVSAVYQESAETYSAIAGSITITSHNTQNKTLKGSFFFNAENSQDETVEVTGGYFETHY